MLVTAFAPWLRLLPQRRERLHGRIRASWRGGCRCGLVDLDEPLLCGLELLDASRALAHGCRRVGQQRVASRVAAAVGAPDLQADALATELARFREKLGRVHIAQLLLLSLSPPPLLLLLLLLLLLVVVHGHTESL